MIKPIIICIDDEKAVLNSLRQELTYWFGKDFGLEMAESALEAIDLVKELNAEQIEIAVIISDQLMPGMKGDELLAAVHQTNPDARKILLTGQASAEAIGKAVNKAMLYRYIPKPWESEDLRLTVTEAINSYRTNRALSNKIALLQELQRNSTELAQTIHFEEAIELLLQQIICYTDAFRVFIQLAIPHRNKSYYYKIKELTNNNSNSVFFSQKSADIELIEKFISQIAEKEIFTKYTAPPYLSFNLTGIQDFYTAPIQKGNKHLGRIYLDTSSSQFDADIQEYLSLLLVQAAITLDNALLYEQLEEKVIERTRTIEEKNQHITDSIKYARRIQLAILPEITYLNDIFTESFILYSPRDIVSGDFYWFEKIDNYFFIAAVDCTGHGVPGAFMSVLGSSLLNQVIQEHKIFEPAEIVCQLHLRVCNALHQDSSRHDAQVMEGMDLVICRIDLVSMELSWCNARRPLLIYRKNTDTLTEYRGGKFTVGGGLTDELGNPLTFTSETQPLSTGDTFYLYTDGIIDQFGGTNGRKFTHRRLQHLIQQSIRQPLHQQQQLIQTELHNWMKNYKQIDDILIIGIRV
jgi:serine phosphatase RsbU (regulator of sigma subunit)/FixJ family two-component response regulator